SGPIEGEMTSRTQNHAIRCLFYRASAPQAERSQRQKCTTRAQLQPQQSAARQPGAARYLHLAVELWAGRSRGDGADRSWTDWNGGGWRRAAATGRELRLAGRIRREAHLAVQLDSQEIRFGVKPDETVAV